MARIDRLKAEIGFNEKQFFAAIAIVATLVAWCVSEYLTAHLWLVSGAIVLIILISLVAFFKHRRVSILLEALENAE